MRILLLFPSFYSLDKTIKSGFENLNHTVLHSDFRKTVNKYYLKANTQTFRLPFWFRNKWDKYYLNLVNKKHIEVFNDYQPEIVFIYNNELLLPDTIKHFKDSRAKIIFFLGDSPYFTFTNRYYLSLLFLADLIISPDSFWAAQLNLLGIKNVKIDFPGFNNDLMNFRDPTKEEIDKYNFDLIFVGTGYVDSWGFKRALFVSKFADLNLKVFGSRHWLNWLDLFPELSNKFELIKHRVSDEQMIIMNKCAKVYPVDANPAVLNGLHLRVFDCISSGILPIVEYRKDLYTFFKDVDLPIIKDYNRAMDLAQKYIDNDQLRENTYQELLEFTIANYSAEVVLDRILSTLW